MVNYKFLILKSVNDFLNENDYTFSDFIRMITSEKLTGLQINNRGVLDNISNKDWFEILNEAFEYEKE